MTDTISFGRPWKIENTNVSLALISSVPGPKIVAAIQMIIRWPVSSIQTAEFFPDYIGLLLILNMSPAQNKIEEK